MQSTTSTAKPSARVLKLALALAALADPARNPNENERAVALAKLIAHCEKHGLTLADYVKPVASPDAGAAAKPETDAKPRTSRKPADKPATDPRDAERERAAANRAHTMRHYAGASQASHAQRAPKLAEALARVATPIQRAKSASPRDESALALALKHADKAHTFCPVAGTFDLGVLSRLASLGLIAVAGERIALTKAGLDLARIVSKRAA